MNECWICQGPALWRVTGKKEGTPTVLIEFYACPKHVPIAVDGRQEAAEEKAHGA